MLPFLDCTAMDFATSSHANQCKTGVEGIQVTTTAKLINLKIVWTDEAKKTLYYGQTNNYCNEYI